MLSTTKYMDLILLSEICVTVSHICDSTATQIFANGALARVLQSTRWGLASQNLKVFQDLRVFRELRVFQDLRVF